MTDIMKEAFERAYAELGSPDDVMGNHHLDEGELYYIWGQAWRACEAGERVEIAIIGGER